MEASSVPEYEAPYRTPPESDQSASPRLGRPDRAIQFFWVQSNLGLRIIRGNCMVNSIGGTRLFTSRSTGAILKT